MFCPKRHLTHFVPSNSEWVAFPSPSNIGAKMHRWDGAGKTYKNVHISTVNTAVLPSLSDTISLSSSPIYSESSAHPSSQSSTLCLLSSSMKSLYPMLQKTNFLWIAIVFPLIWVSKQRNRESQSSLPSTEGNSFWNWFGCVFQDDSRAHRTRPSLCGRHKHNHEERGPRSAIRNVLNSLP